MHGLPLISNIFFKSNCTCRISSLCDVMMVLILRKNESRVENIEEFTKNT